MKLLLDANLSWRLVKQLSLHFGAVIHIDQTALPFPAKDNEIWNYAKENQYSIVTNDDDFLRLIAMKGFPPKIILLRMGNQSNQHILELLIKKKKEIESFEQSAQYGLLEIY